MIDKITEMEKVLADPYTYCKKYKEDKNKKVVGYLCSYAPEELIYAAGALPVRLFGGNEGIHRADVHLQSYCCSLVRNILEEALSGRIDFIDGVIFPHTCDSIQRLSDVWRLNIPQMFHVDFVLPVKLNTESARQYLTDILEKLKNDLEVNLGVKISDEKIMAAIKTYNQIRSAMMRLYEIRCQNPKILSGHDFHTIIRAAMIMDREKFLDDLTQILVLLEKSQPDKTKADNKRLILSGSVCNQPDIYGMIENAGAAVVWDNLCTGFKYFDGVIDLSLPPLAGITKRYLDRAVCPAKHTGLTDRGKDIVQAVKQNRADGVVFLFLKFCDPHAFDYPYIKEMLDAENIPCLLVDMEEQLPAGGAIADKVGNFYPDIVMPVVL